VFTTCGSEESRSERHMDGGESDGLRGGGENKGLKKKEIYHF
jgi:hypothetical protein